MMYFTHKSSCSCVDVVRIANEVIETELPYLVQSRLYKTVNYTTFLIVITLPKGMFVMACQCFSQSKIASKTK